MKLKFLIAAFALVVVGLVSGCQTMWRPFGLEPNFTEAVSDLEITQFEVEQIGEGLYALNACTRGFNGVGITLKVSVLIEGTWQVLKELGVPCFSEQDRPTWNATIHKAGFFTFRLQVRGPDQAADWSDSVQAFAVLGLP